MKKKPIRRKSVKTPQAKLADKFNKRIREYNKIFGKTLANDIITSMIGDITGVDYTKSGFISSSSFTNDHAEITIKALDRDLITAKANMKVIKKDIIENWKRRGLQGPPNLTIKNIGNEIIARNTIEDEFEEYLAKYYDLKDLEFTEVPEELEKNIGGGNPFNSYQHMRDVLNEIKDLVAKHG